MIAVATTLSLVANTQEALKHYGKKHERKRKGTELKRERKTSNQVSQCNYTAFLPTVV